MHIHTFAADTRTQAPSQSMRGVALPCAKPAGLGWRREADVCGADSWSGTRIGGRDFGNSVGGAPA